MVLSDEDIAKFQTLYRNQFGIEISREDAYEKGVKLLRLLSVVYRPITKSECEEIQKHRKDTAHLLIKNIKQYE
jgi:hypothetical protein